MAHWAPILSDLFTLLGSLALMTFPFLFGFATDIDSMRRCESEYPILKSLSINAFDWWRIGWGLIVAGVSLHIYSELCL
jgi:hypothetical protein